MQEPVYIKIHNQLKKDIENKKYAVGARIPAERKLALEFNVSRMTLRQAIKTLEDEGILERRLGSGTYVASQKVKEKMMGIMSFTDITKLNHQTASTRLISYRVTQPSLTEREKLNLNSMDEVLRMERVRSADNIPICYEVATIPYTLVKNFSKAELSAGLYQTLIEKGGYQIGKVVENIGAAIATEMDARLLSVNKGEALVTRRQVTFLQNKMPFEYVRAFYVADRFEFTFEK